MTSPEKGISHRNIHMIEFGGREIPVRNKISLEVFLSEINFHDPGARVLVATLLSDYSRLYGWVVYPVAGIFTDATIEGSSNDQLILKGQPTYIGWVSTEAQIPEPLQDSKIVEGASTHYRIKTHLSMPEVRKRLEAVPGNTVQLIYDDYSSFLRAGEKHRMR